MGAHPHNIANVIYGKKSNWKGLSFKHAPKGIPIEQSQESRVLLENFLRNKTKEKPGAKPVFCAETNTIYSSLMEATRQLNITSHDIAKVLSGKVASAKSFTFKYLKKQVFTSFNTNSLPSLSIKDNLNSL